MYEGPPKGKGRFVSLALLLAAAVLFTWMAIRTISQGETPVGICFAILAIFFLTVGFNTLGSSLVRLSKLLVSTIATVIGISGAVLFYQSLVIERTQEIVQIESNKEERSADEQESTRTTTIRHDGTAKIHQESPFARSILLGFAGIVMLVISSIMVWKSTSQKSLLDCEGEKQETS